MKLESKTYDILKYIALIALPALQVFWLTIGKIWSIDYTVEIGATIGAVALLLGTLLGVSTKNWLADKEQDNFNYEEVEMFDEEADEYEAETDTAEEE